MRKYFSGYSLLCILDKEAGLIPRICNVSTESLDYCTDIDECVCRNYLLKLKRQREKKFNSKQK